jgi:hypothetical protein
MSGLRRDVRLIRYGLVVGLAAVGYLVDPILGKEIALMSAATVATFWILAPKGLPGNRVSHVIAFSVAVLMGVLVLDLDPVWLPLLVVTSIEAIPAFLATVIEFVRDEDTQSRKVLFWWVWSLVRRAMRVVLPLAILLVAWLAWGHGWQLLLLLPAAIAAAVGRPAIAVVNVLLTAPWMWESTAWRAMTTLSLLFALSHRKVEPPRRSVGLPYGFSPIRNPLQAMRVARIDRHLARGAWDGARSRATALSNTPGPAHAAAMLRCAVAALAQDHIQDAFDALKPIADSAPPEFTAWRELIMSQALLRAAQPDAALEHLDRALGPLMAGREFNARWNLTRAQALLSLAQPGQALAAAETAMAGLKGKGMLTERFRCLWVLQRCRWELDDLTGALKIADDSLVLALSTRWMRQYLGSLGSNRSDEAVIFGRDAQLLVDFQRLDLLETRIKMDPRYTDDRPAEVRDDQTARSLEMSSMLFDVTGASLDLASTNVTWADLLMKQGENGFAMGILIEAIAELDRVRHSLQAQADRSAWASIMNEALTIALQTAVRNEDPAVVAEVIELSRVQALPLLGDESSEDTVAIASPPTVRVRGVACIARGGDDAEPRPPVDLEMAAASAAGPGAWWLSFWHDGNAVTWAVVPPAGELFFGQIAGDRYGDLRITLIDLEANLPVIRRGETEADVDLRIYGAAFRRSPQREAELSQALGDLLLPDPLRTELQARHILERDPLPLAIAPDPLLGQVPWGLLAVAMPGQEEGSLRLMEACSWTLAPSATLLALTSRDGTPNIPKPLRLAILDPADVPELREARLLASKLPGVRILGGRHWSDSPATRSRIFSALSEVGPDSSVLFGCHAVRGDARRPSDSALIIAGSDDQHPCDALTASQLLRNGTAPQGFPAQVSLQACDTSDLASSTSGEWLSLAPAFLAAGARAVTTTQFPLVDVELGADDGLLSALRNGDNLVEAVRLHQLDGLQAWRGQSGKGIPPLETTPLVWAAHAVCATGRAGAMPPAPQIAISTACIDLFESVLARMNRDSRPQLVTSADLMGYWLSMRTELLEGTFLPSMMKEFLSEIGVRYMGGRRAPAGDGPRLSYELMAALPEAGRRAVSTGALQTEHIIASIAEGPSSPGRRLLQLLRLHDTLVLRRTIAANLREQQSRMRANANSGVASDAERRALSDLILSCAGASHTH